MERHPLAASIPWLQGEQYEQLRREVERLGSSENVVTWDGQIIRGWEAAKAMDSIGIEYGTLEVGDRLQEDEIVDYVLKGVGGLPQYTPGQRAMAGARLLPQYQEEAQQRRIGNLPQFTGLQDDRTDRQLVGTWAGRATQYVARLVASNHEYVRQAYRLLREEADLAEQVEAGTLAITDAWDQRNTRKREATARAAEQAVEDQEAAEELSPEEQRAQARQAVVESARTAVTTPGKSLKVSPNALDNALGAIVVLETCIGQGITPTALHDAAAEAGVLNALVRVAHFLPSAAERRHIMRLLDEADEAMSGRTLVHSRRRLAADEYARERLRDTIRRETHLLQDAEAMASTPQAM